MRRNNNKKIKKFIENRYLNRKLKKKADVFPVLWFLPINCVFLDIIGKTKF